jgi:hypothetical protein
MWVHGMLMVEINSNNVLCAYGLLIISYKSLWTCVLYLLCHALAFSSVLMSWGQDSKLKRLSQVSLLPKKATLRSSRGSAPGSGGLEPVGTLGIIANFGQLCLLPIMLGHDPISGSRTIASEGSCATASGT